MVTRLVIKEKLPSPIRVAPDGLTLGRSHQGLFLYVFDVFSLCAILTGIVAPTPAHPDCSSIEWPIHLAIVD